MSFDVDFVLSVFSLNLMVVLVDDAHISQKLTAATM